jgi:hypothetical protein
MRHKLSAEKMFRAYCIQGFLPTGYAMYPGAGCEEPADYAGTDSAASSCDEGHPALKISLHDFPPKVDEPRSQFSASLRP